MKPDPQQHIFERDNFTCQYCGWYGATNFEQWMLGSMSFDHIVPRKHGGTEDDSNIVVACHRCNKLKGQEMCSSVEEGRAIIARKLEEQRAWFNHFVLKDSNEAK